jgi:uncharacterized DUF497 family protein
MDIHFQLGRQRFDWDSEKAASNKVKHGISFERAAEVFVDPFVEFVKVDVPEESREAAIGQTLDQSLLYIVNIERDDLSIRIISARQATARERGIYEERE